MPNFLFIVCPMDKKANVVAIFGNDNAPTTMLYEIADAATPRTQVYWMGSALATPEQETIAMDHMASPTADPDLEGVFFALRDIEDVITPGYYPTKVQPLVRAGYDDVNLTTDNGVE